MTQHNDGGPAFPPMHNPETHASGMSLRDWFAGQANETDIEQYRDFYFCKESCDFAPKYTREQAKYRYADAMLKARKAQP